MARKTLLIVAAIMALSLFAFAATKPDFTGTLNLLAMTRPFFASAAPMIDSYQQGGSAFILRSCLNKGPDLL